MKRKGMEPMHSQHINVTPLIDVIMCLIIFFLLCGQFVKDESKVVNLPQAQLGTEMLDQEGRLLINLVPHENAPGTAAGNSVVPPDIYIHGGKVSAADLAAVLEQDKAKNADLKVIIRADQDLTYDWISPVLVACAQANITSVNFSTRRKE